MSRSFDRFEIDDFRDSDSGWRRDAERDRSSEWNNRFALHNIHREEERADKLDREGRERPDREHPSLPREERVEAMLSERSRTKYADRNKEYSLRSSEIHTLGEVGKFRVVGMNDLAEFAYNGDRSRARNDIENLTSQGLLTQTMIADPEHNPTQVLTLTKEGHKLLSRGKVVVFLIAITGMRVSELLALQWPDIDFQRRLIHVRRTFYRGSFGLPKTPTSERVIPMSDGLSLALQRHKHNARENDLALVFPNADGRPYEAANLLRRLLHPALAKCGLPRTGWRVFRRSVATTLSEMREPVRTAQQLLGHSSPHTTLRFYTQSVEDSERNAISKLERILFQMFPRSKKGRH